MSGRSMIKKGYRGWEGASVIKAPTLTFMEQKDKRRACGTMTLRLICAVLHQPNYVGEM